MAMRETVYLVISRYKVERMTKNMPELKRGEIPVKILVEVEDSAFREPVIERTVTVVDWREGIDLGDIDIREATITEEEAELIRQRRLTAMRKILEEHGFEVTQLLAGEDTEQP